MKKLSLITAVIAAAMLAGCTDGGTSNAPESTTSTTSLQATIEKDVENSGPSSNAANSDPLPFTLFGADKVQITFADVISATDYDGNTIAPADVKDPDWYEIICDGFAYLAEPSISLNSRDNADQYDPEKLLFNDLPEYSNAE